MDVPAAAKLDGQLPSPPLFPLLYDTDSNPSVSALLRLLPSNLARRKYILNHSTNIIDKSLRLGDEEPPRTQNDPRIG